tara:strand:- start:2025 stop:2858 length:834 start_codon:yes stop_codon:yes gene_type:complete
MTKFINDLPELEATYLVEQFRYDPETGLLTWIAKRQGVPTGSIAGRQRHGSDSAHVALNKLQYPVELIVWVMRRGSWPSHVPYHLDRNRLNNRIDNLALPVGAHQIKPIRQRSMPHVLARIDAAHAATPNPAPTRMTATDIAVALAPRKRNNRGRRAATVSVTLDKASEAPKTALEAMRILLQDTQASLLEQRDNPPDMSPAPENIAGRTAVIEYTRKLANIEERIQSMQRKIATMEEQDAQNPMTSDTATHQPIKGLSTLQGLFAKALGGTPHKIT